ATKVIVDLDQRRLHSKQADVLSSGIYSIRLLARVLSNINVCVPHGVGSNIAGRRNPRHR
ncbi:MAG: hypothetical protein WBE81_16020, partial [Pseudolabrys sp.]